MDALQRNFRKMEAGQRAGNLSEGRTDRRDFSFEKRKATTLEMTRPTSEPGIFRTKRGVIKIMARLKTAVATLYKLVVSR